MILITANTPPLGLLYQTLCLSALALKSCRGVKYTYSEAKLNMLHRMLILYEEHVS